MFYNLIWAYATHKGRLLNPQADQVAVEALSSQYVYGVPGYSVVLLVALVNFPVSLVLSILMAIFFAFPSKPIREKKQTD